jgi:hypothetical protein
LGKDLTNERKAREIQRYSTGYDLAVAMSLKARAME